MVQKLRSQLEKQKAESDIALQNAYQEAFDQMADSPMKASFATATTGPWASVNTDKWGQWPAVEWHPPSGEAVWGKAGQWSVYKEAPTYWEDAKPCDLDLRQFKASPAGGFTPKFRRASPLARLKYKIEDVWEGLVNAVLG